MKRFPFVVDIKYPITTRTVNRSARPLYAYSRPTKDWWPQRWPIYSPISVAACFCALITLSEYTRLAILVFLLGNKRLLTNCLRYNLNKHRSSRRTQLFRPFDFMSTGVCVRIALDVWENLRRKQSRHVHRRYLNCQFCLFAAFCRSEIKLTREFIVIDQHE